MTSPVQEIKERLDIVEFIRSYTPLQPAGKNFKALCPFHKEKTPSFMVSPERQSWHCFGACGEGGDIFKFLMKYENLEFYEALKILAEKAGVELRKISPADQKQFGILYDINEAAKNFFISQLMGKIVSEPLNYLKERGLKKETIDEFELGFSPADFDELSRYLMKSGYDIKDIERAGLIYKTERGSYIDRFRQRIMFPLYNHFGKVVGFSGRIIPRLESEKPELGKYVNSPETLIFNKSRILYGFHKTKKHILEKKEAIFVEGQMDFLMAYQDGVKNVVAVSGTALTPDHLKTVRRLADRITFFFDNDEAGFKAAERSIDLANANDFTVKLLVVKDYKDPAEIVQKSPGLLVNVIDKAKPAMEFYFDRYLKNAEPNGEVNSGKSGNFRDFKINVRVILSKIKNLISAVEKAHWLKQLALKTKVDEKSLAEEMEQIKQISTSQFSNSNQIQNQKSKIQNSRRELICQRLIGLTMTKDTFRPMITECLDYFPHDYLSVFESLAEQTELSDERLINLLNTISLRSAFESSIFDEEKIEEEFRELIKQLRAEFLKEKRQTLIYSIKEAQQNGDDERVVSILEEFHGISKSMQT